MLTTLAARREMLTRRLVQISLVLAIASYSMQLFVRTTGHDFLFGLARALDVDQEQSLSTWFQVLVLAFCGAALWACGSHETSQRRKRDWRVWAVILAGMSMDEQVGLHERMRVPLQLLGSFHAFQHYSWVVFGLPVAVLAMLVAGRFVFELPPDVRIRFLGATAVYLIGAIGLEVAAGAWMVMGLPRDAVYAILPTTEELLEMLGMIALLDATLRVIAAMRLASDR